VPARILIIEDNEANLELMSYLLRAFGHTVLAAGDGEKGLAMVSEAQPDLVLCDIQLPGIGGMEVAARLRASAGRERLALLAVTALAMVGDRETILSAGFDGYLSKPIDPRAFIQQVESFLPAELRGTRVQPMPAAAQADTAVPGRRATILAVDDRAENLHLAVSLLAPHGYRVVTAASMREALRLALESPPDLILSDVCMADGDGYEFIREVKARRELRAIPFLFLTSTMIKEADRKRGLALGAVKYLFRPIDPRELLEHIEACFPAAGR
jgi:two-component system, cell cycle response regulator